jgi:hypothetical protein
VGFAGGAQALVEGLQDRVGAGGAEWGHEEGPAHVAAAAANGAGAAIGAAVAMERGHAGLLQSGDEALVVNARGLADEVWTGEAERRRLLSNKR